MENQNLENVNITVNVNGEEEKINKNGSKKIIVLIIGLILLAGILFLLVKKLTTVKKTDYKAIPAVNTTHIITGNIAKEVSVIGTILPNNTYFVPAKVGGELKAIYVENGDYVKKGDPICEIDASKEIEAAFIQYDAAKKAYDRMQKLYKAGDISLQSFETVKAQYDAAKLSYDTKVEYSTPVAVGDGIVENTNMTINTNVKVENVLCYITSDDGKEINFGVTERVLSGIEFGEKVKIEKGGKVYDGYVSNIASLINAQTGLFDVKAVITSENNFASGINAKVTFEYDRRKDVFILPNDLIYYEEGNAFVYTVGSDNVVTKKYVEVGLENEKICEIINGVDENTKIVSTWNTDLAEGVLVNVVAEEKLNIETETIDETIENEAIIKETMIEEALIEETAIVEITTDEVTIIDENVENEKVNNKADIKEIIESTTIAVESVNSNEKTSGNTIVASNNEIENIEESELSKIVEEMETVSVDENADMKLANESDDSDFIRKLKAGEWNLEDIDGTSTNSNADENVEAE